MNFDQMIDRRGTGAAKWDARTKLFGRDDVIPMWVADMDFAAPEPVLMALQKQVEHGVFGYALPSDELNEAIVKWMSQRHGWQIQSDWLIYVPGVVPALSLSVLSFSKPGEGVVIQPPVYYPFYDVVNRNNRQLFLNPLRLHNGRYSMDLDHLEAMLKKESNQIRLLILCSPHNPVGRVWTEEELRALGKLCSAYGVKVLSDEIHFDLVFPKYKHMPFGSISEELAQQSIVFTAPSKTFNLAGLQLSYMIVPNPEWRETLKKETARLFLNPLNPINIAASKAAYEEGGSWLDALLAYLQDNAALARLRIEQMLPNVQITELQGTYLMWLDFRRCFESAQSLKRWAVHEAKVGFSEGKQFGKEGEGFVRMNIACPRAMLQQALDQMEKAAQALEKCNVTEL